MKKRYLFIMVGCPGSGKSYFLQNTELTKNSIVVSRDKVRFSIISDEDEYFAKEKQVFAEFINQIQKGLDSGKNVYADATHLTGVSRYKLMNALNLNNVGIIPIYFDTPLEVCLERNKMRTGRARVPDSVIKNMYFSLTDPANDEENMNFKYDDILYVDYQQKQVI